MTTRRAILAGLALPATSVAQQLPVPAGLLRAAEHHPDEVLFDLERRWGPADAAYTASCVREEALEHIGLPPRPDVLGLRDADFDLGLRELAVKDHWGDVWFCLVGEQGATLRRPHGRVRYVPVPADHPLAGRYTKMSARVPWPERQARADEIVRAWDQWQAEIVAAQGASGYTVARDESARLGVISGDLERAIEAATPRTLDGLAVKARLLREQVFRGWDTEDFAATVADDILRLAGGVA